MFKQRLLSTKNKLNHFYERFCPLFKVRNDSDNAAQMMYSIIAHVFQSLRTFLKTRNN